MEHVGKPHRAARKDILLCNRNLPRMKPGTYLSYQIGHTHNIISWSLFMQCQLFIGVVQKI